jgi:malate synthase
MSVEIKGAMLPGFEQILTPEAVEFTVALQRKFNATRKELLKARAERQAAFDAGAKFDFLPKTKAVREGNWKVASIPADLQDRRVEITGPVDRKMVINALNSGAKVFMADFEDSCTPNWENVVEGHLNLINAIERRIEFTNADGKVYKLKEKVAVLIVRPRGWHLHEKHMVVDGELMSGALMDFGLYCFHNAKRLLGKGSGPYFYLPKTESYLEARLWNDVFSFAEDYLGVPRATIKATVLIEVITAAFQMDEILYELREHIAGLNAGRWDYIFSVIKKFNKHADMLLPDRSQVTMTVPFMRAYAELLVKTCHKRDAFAMGGMSAFIPSRRDAEINERALAAVRVDKAREAGDGFDGTWVAHPDLVAVARAEFDKVLGSKPNQVDKQRPEVNVAGADLINVAIPGSAITEAGLRNNISVAILYMESWLRGNGAVAIYNLMEDAATAEISRSQVWQWVRHGARLNDGTPVTADLVRKLGAEEYTKARDLLGGKEGRLADAYVLFEQIALAEEYTEFLTVPAYNLI